MNKINETFDLDIIPKPPPIIQESNVSLVVLSTEEALIQDIENSRNDFDKIMAMGKDALEKVLTIADEGQHPRFFEAAGLIIKSLTDTNKERVELHLKLSQLRKNQVDVQRIIDPKSPITIDKAIFTGTTKDLLDLVHPKKANNGSS